MTVYRGWYVAEADLLTTAHRDFPERFPIREGETLTLPTSVIPRVRQSGYHACPRLLDAFSYRIEGVITLVEVSGDVSVGDDKIAGRSRKTLRIVPKAVTERECRLFAADVAERLLLAEREAGREPAAASWTAVEIARRFALGDASREELEAARAAARNETARAAEAAAARAAARAAWVVEAWAVAGAAGAAWVVEAWAVAGAAEAARAAMRAALSADLEARILKAIGEES